MLRYFKFRQDLYSPVPGKEIYIKRGPGKGWPEECPPIRAANSFGFDLLANFDVSFRRKGQGWIVEPDTIIQSDFDYASSDQSPGLPLTQQYAWFWEKSQKIPHVISDNVYETIKDQVKISSFLFLQTDPNELLMFGPVPNLVQPFRVLSGLVDTDWFPASYPWHVMIELDPKLKKIEIKKGDPLCRVTPLRRDTYFAGQMTPGAFDEYFARGQAWLAAHGSAMQDDSVGTVDITHTYVRQQIKSKFVVMP